MTLQNRVDPWGRLLAVNARGSLLGNRGMLHNEERQIVRDWQRMPWVTCALEFQGRKREIFGRTTYSELFFLDDATAFSAGHRPCATCRRERYNEFKTSWLAVNGELFSMTNPSINEIDKVFHRERIDRNGTKVTFEAPLSSLPLGTVVDINDEAFLVWHQGLKRWSFNGYSDLQLQPSPSTLVRVLTPESVVRTFAGGFRPIVHASANR
ncbi:MAG: hypothetical protein A3E79_03205 [Burkholderiales bacterium RIFCSPHIGHO2_12_FULL_61_11]|nr:MAG: hypothetical protein A3E79_03205 [Burkholderiales bacterium RIFCSPHIGHO2_12_FULL_61_11]